MEQEQQEVSYHQDRADVLLHRQMLLDVEREHRIEEEKARKEREWGLKKEERKRRKETVTKEERRLKKDRKKKPKEGKEGKEGKKDKQNGMDKEGNEGNERERVSESENDKEDSSLQLAESFEKLAQEVVVSMQSVQSQTQKRKQQETEQGKTVQSFPHSKGGVEDIDTSSIDTGSAITNTNTNTNTNSKNKNQTKNQNKIDQAQKATDDASSDNNTPIITNAEMSTTNAITTAESKHAIYAASSDAPTATAAPEGERLRGSLNSGTGNSSSLVSISKATKTNGAIPGNTGSTNKRRKKKEKVQPKTQLRVRRAVSKRVASSGSGEESWPEPGEFPSFASISTSNAASRSAIGSMSKQKRTRSPAKPRTRATVAHSSSKISEQTGTPFSADISPWDSTFHNSESTSKSNSNSSTKRKREAVSSSGMYKGKRSSILREGAEHPRYNNANGSEIEKNSDVSDASDDSISVPWFPEPSPQRNGRRQRMKVKFNVAIGDTGEEDSSKRQKQQKQQQQEEEHQHEQQQQQQQQHQHPQLQPNSSTSSTSNTNNVYQHPSSLSNRISSLQDISPQQTNSSSPTLPRTFQHYPISNSSCGQEECIAGDESSRETASDAPRPTNRGFHTPQHGQKDNPTAMHHNSQSSYYGRDNDVHVTPDSFTTNVDGTGKYDLNADKNFTNAQLSTNTGISTTLSSEENAVPVGEASSDFPNISSEAQAQEYGSYERDSGDVKVGGSSTRPGSVPKYCHGQSSIEGTLNSARHKRAALLRFASLRTSSSIAISTPQRKGTVVRKLPFDASFPSSSLSKLTVTHMILSSISFRKEREFLLLHAQVESFYEGETFSKNSREGQSLSSVGARPKLGENVLVLLPRTCFSCRIHEHLAINEQGAKLLSLWPWSISQTFPRRTVFVTSFAGIV